MWLLVQATGDAYLAERPMLALVTALAWSPLFFSVPALLLQRERDRFAPAATGPLASLWRAVRLIPHLALSPRSTVRLESSVSILVWGVFVHLWSADIAVAVTRLI